MAVTLADSGSQGRARQHDQLQLMGHTADGSDSTIGGTGGSGTGGSGGSGGSGGGSTVVVTSLQVGGTLNVFVGQSSQLSATAHFSDGSSADVTASVSWSSSNGALASISGGGQVSGLVAGAVTITATYQSMSASTTIPITL